MQKIIPFLWFDKNAEEAINFYVSVFSKNPSSAGVSKIVSIHRYPEGQQIGPMKDMEGKVLTAIFELDGQRFMALDGGPMFRFTEVVSLYVECGEQEEVDYFWEKLTDGGEESMCGWLKDKYGLSWPIIPAALGQLLSDPDPVKSQRVMQAMLQMKKIDMGGLNRAYEG